MHDVLLIMAVNTIVNKRTTFVSEAFILDWGRGEATIHLELAPFRMKMEPESLPLQHSLPANRCSHAAS